MDTKQFMAFEFKTDDVSESNDVGVFEGYASTFGNVDLGLDVVDKGAFKRTLKSSKGRFPILLDHDPTRPAGWNLEAYEDDRGLKVKGELMLEHPDVKHRWKLMKRGHELGQKMGLSIGYQTVKHEIVRGDPAKGEPTIRRLKEVKLFEYSPVTFPMNEMATTTSAKALSEFIQGVQQGRYDLNQIQKALQQLGLKKPDDGPADDDETDPELLHSVDRLIAQLRS